MRILVAPNAFKNSLSAEGAADAIRLGLLESGLPCDIQHFPIGDGGNGTGSLLVLHKRGFFREVEVSDPLGRKIKTTIGYMDEGRTAVIELANASGLHLLQKYEYDPLRANTCGTGEMIRTALHTGLRKIILCVGGSATVDGGLGILATLGMRFMDIAHQEICLSPENLIDLRFIDTRSLDEKIATTEFVILCDVENVLLGDQGAAAVFGPQKGASTKEVQQLDQSLLHFRNIILDHTGKDAQFLKYGGAAGGVAAALHIFLGAQLVSGIEYFLDATDFASACINSDLLITGEGRIDAQTLQGKGPFGVARRAKQFHLKVIGLAGEIHQAHDERLLSYFDQLIPINRAEDTLEMSMKNTAKNLQAVARNIGISLNAPTP